MEHHYTADNTPSFQYRDPHFAEVNQELEVRRIQMIDETSTGAFLIPIEDNSNAPRFNSGEYALVEPNTKPEIEDDVLVRLVDGRTMLKRLLSRQGSVCLGSHNDHEIIDVMPNEVVWMYYVAHPVPSRNIEDRIGGLLDNDQRGVTGYYIMYFVETHGTRVHHIIVGPLHDRQEAKALFERLKPSYPNAYWGRYEEE